MTTEWSTSTMPPNMISVPSWEKLLWPAVRALKAMGGSGTNDEILAKIIEIENISPEIQELPHTDNRQTRLAYNLGWAKTALKKRDAVQNSSKGVWSLTKFGETLTSDDMKRIADEVKAKYILAKKTSETIDIGKKPDDVFENSKIEPVVPLDAEDIDAAASPWKDQLLAVLLRLHPGAFERLAQRAARGGISTGQSDRKKRRWRHRRHRGAARQSDLVPSSLSVQAV